MAKMKWYDILAIILMIAGSLAWGSIGFFQVNPVAYLLGAGFLSTVIYCLVGIAGLYAIIALTNISIKDPY